MESLRELGTVVWLGGDFASLYARAQRAGERPMLAGRTPADVEALYRAREPFYRRADLTVDTSALGADQVAARVARLLAERARGACPARAAGA